MRMSIVEEEENIVYINLYNSEKKIKNSNLN